MTAQRYILKPEFGRLMRKVQQGLRGFRWCLIGGRAVEVWTNPPQTPDADILAGVTDDAVPLIVDRFGKLGVEVRDAKTGLGAPLLFFEDVQLHIELDVLGAYAPLHDFVLESAQSRTLHGIRIKVATPAALVLLKAEAAVDPSRAKHVRDVNAILAVARAQKLDPDYLESAIQVCDMPVERKLLVRLGILKETDRAD